MLEDIHYCEECGGSLEYINSVEKDKTTKVDLYRCRSCGRLVFI